MSNPLRQQFGFNTDLTGYSPWVPTHDGNVIGGNYSETYYRVDGGIVTLDICICMVIGTTTNSTELTDLPVAPEGTTVVSSAMTLKRAEDNSNMASTLSLNAPVNPNLLTLTSDGDNMVEGGVYVVAGTLSYPETP